MIAQPRYVLMTLCLSFATAFILAPSTVHAQNLEGTSSVRLLWAFGALVGPPDDRKLVAVDRDRVLHSGDRIKFMLTPQTSCAIYLFHMTGQHRLTLLYPPTIEHTSTQTGMATLVPPGDRWFALDDETGIEKFYLLASQRPIDRIASIYRRYLAAASESDRQSIATEFVSAVKEMRREHFRNKGPVERPIHLGGNFRGTEEATGEHSPDLTRIAVAISAPGFYSRTFTIDHR